MKPNTHKASEEAKAVADTAIRQRKSVLYWLISGRVATTNDFHYLLGIGTSSTPSRVTELNKPKKFDQLICREWVYYTSPNGATVRNTLYSIKDEKRRMEVMETLKLTPQSVDVFLAERMKDMRLGSRAWALYDKTYQAKDAIEYVSMQKKYAELRITRSKNNGNNAKISNKK